MKTSFVRILFHFVYLCAFVSIISAQEKPQALKFDEFEDPVENPLKYYQDELSLTERAKRFSTQFRKQPGAKAYIIYYQGRITDDFYNYLLKNKLNRMLWDIRPENDYTNETVKIIDGGHRENTIIEFWIAPKNSEPPKPTPTLNDSETVVCPHLSVYGNNPINEPDTLEFAISEYNLKNLSEYTLKWQVNGGKIVSDQGLSEVRVKLNDGVKRATAFVEISGLPFPCPKISSATAEVKGKLYLIDEFGREPNGQIKARLDAFLTVLQDNPTAQGYVINYGNRNDKGTSLVRRNELVDKHLITDRIADKSRMTFVNGGFREDVATELWLSFDGNQKPVPNPTVDKRFVEVPVSKRKSVRRK